MAETNPQNENLVLPEAPASDTGPVKVWKQAVTMPTYAPGLPDRNPMFLKNRVYQGSSGRVYPIPVIDRIATEPVERAWDAFHLENDYLRLMILPEIGGRIHVAYDKTNAYDFFYRQNVIKPALVGLAGPWISGGVEFNWPQHHRPATFMPVEVAIERASDGSVTIWCSDHDPLQRMKGMHGVCLYPGRAYIELKVRLYNRTPYVQTFLWWANVACRVHEKYQSFFPPDVRFVADHAKRAITSFPLSARPYYGVDYPARACNGIPEEELPSMFVPDSSYLPNDLSRYANIPVPTSYMVAHTKQDFFGGYDHAAEAGFVHVANHHIAPGKKQWTWGNHEFGYAWDRNLTDNNGPYIELMAGVYTDNQPDFAFLAPGETKSFSQFWYPIHKIGPPQAANLDAAVSLRVKEHVAYVGVSVTRPIIQAEILLRSGHTTLSAWTEDLHPAKAFSTSCGIPNEFKEAHLTVSVRVNGRELVRFSPKDVVPADAPEAAREPLLPAEIATNDELYLTGLHLEQYRHATRRPEIYWEEAIRRDPGDSRCHNALGLWRLHRGEFALAEQHFLTAIKRLTQLNPNPYDGEAYYNLGLALRLQEKDDEAYTAFYKATWNETWVAPAFHALAEIDAKRHYWQIALDHLDLSLRAGTENLNARNLKVIALHNLKRDTEATLLLEDTRGMDPLDVWSRFIDRAILPPNGQLALDLSFDLLRAGLFEEALQVLAGNSASQDGSRPISLYLQAYIHARMGNREEADRFYAEASQANPDYCFPSRLEEQLILETAVDANPRDARGFYYLGNLLYDKNRHEEAIALWEKSSNLNPRYPVVWRNLGIAYFNILRDAQKAFEAFERAIAHGAGDARILYERDQLWKRLGRSPEERLCELNRFPELVQLRDDLALEMATLLNQTNKPEEALRLLTTRKFQPWEGGEGQALAQYVRANLLLGKRALKSNHIAGARSFFEAPLHPPHTLSEAKHLLANWSDVYFWIGTAYAGEGRPTEAHQAWERAARQRGDFQQMSVRSISSMTFWSAMALEQLGRTEEARQIFEQIYEYSLHLENQVPRIDYFATSLPAILLFEEDLNTKNRVEAKFLRAQVNFGLKHFSEAEALLNEILLLDRNYTAAIDLLEQLPR